jgi:CHAD domain-containing protein
VADTTTDAGTCTYRGLATAGAPDLSGLRGVAREVVEAQGELEIERYDTDDRRLAGAGVVLAVHRAGDGEHWELDLPDAPGAEQIRVAGTAAGDRPPAELDELVRGVRRNRPLRPIGRVRTIRRPTQLRAEDGRLLARIVHDEVTAATFGSSTDVTAWTEVRLEPGAAGARLRAAVAQRIAEAGLEPAPPAAVTELDRLLDTWPRRTRRAGPRGSAGAVLMAYVMGQVDRIATEELRVRRDQPDAVHQLRVAARRLRSALQAYRPLLRTEVTGPIGEDLRWLGRALAPARDAEVLRERIAAGLAELPPQLRLGPVQAQVQRHFARAEAEARAAALTELDGERYDALRRALDDLVEHPPLTARAARPARRELPRSARRSARRLERAVIAATSADVAAEERDEAMHAARKAGKRLRYATEVARPAVGKPAKRFAKNLKGLQSALGEHQDTVVAAGALRELGAAAHVAGENGFSFGVLLGRDTARARGIEAELPALWAAAWRRKRRAWLR